MTDQQSTFQPRRPGRESARRHEAWAETAVVLAMVALLLAAVLWLSPELRELRDVASIAGLIVYPVVLTSAGLMYINWRLSASPVDAWSTVVLTMIGVQGLALASLLVKDIQAVHERAGWLLMVQMALSALVLLITIVGAQGAPRTDPFLTGLALGLGVAATTFCLSAWAPHLQHTRYLTAALGLALVVMTLTNAWTLLRQPSLAPWVTSRLSTAIVLLSLSLAVIVSQGGNHATNAIALAGAVAGAALVCGTSLALLRTSIRSHARALRRLSKQLAQVEAEVRQDRGRLHEIGSTVAGIASASRLIQGQDDLSGDRRSGLEDLMRAEVERLERLLRGRGPERRVGLSLDEIIGQRVAAEEARGHQVRWQPSGDYVVARSDDLSEILHILLDNASHHGGDGEIGIEVRSVGERIEIEVSDQGPGISPAVRTQLFDWGMRGPESRGQGIGLNIAQTLAAELGGYLRLIDGQGVGARFVLGLDVSVPSLDATIPAAS